MYFGGKYYGDPAELAAARPTTRFRGILAAAAILILGLAAAATEIDELRGLVREWLVLRRELNEAETAWKAQKTLLSDELRLLQEQKQRLTRELAAGTEAAETASAPLAAARAQKDELASSLSALLQPVRDAEDVLRTWRDKLPPGLLQSLGDVLAKLPAPDAAEDVSNVADRLQAVLGLYTRIEQLNQEIHAGKTVLSLPDGRRLEMDTLFFGIAAGYAVSADGRHAAVGRPGSDGWHWQWDPALAQSVRHAIACYRRESPAAFVRLPLQIVEEGSQ